MLSSKTRRWSAAGLIFIGVLAGVIFASNFNWTTRGLANRKIDDPIVLGNQESADDAILQLQNTGRAFTAISKDLLPTVVSIGTERIVKRSNRDQDMWGDIFRDYFGREFRGQVPETQRQQGLGSGVIVSKDGYICQIAVLKPITKAKGLTWFRHLSKKSMVHFQLWRMMTC